MKILWITNVVFPEAVSLKGRDGDYRGGGGWLLGAASSLIGNNDITLTVATPTSLVDRLELLHGERISYYLIPYGKGNKKYNRNYETYWAEIKKEFNPDVVHIHGTEYTHGLAYINACGKEKVIVSIQGLVSAIAKYYLYGLNISDIIRNITLRDLFKGTIFFEKRNFKNRGLTEVKVLQSVDHVIGRTSWDQAHVKAINPQVHYYHCNEILRNEFYEGEWDVSKCNRYSIFISSASYPIKGFHQLLKAMRIVKMRFPQTQIRIAGSCYPSETVFQRLKMNGYGRYLLRMADAFKLQEQITYLGPLTVGEMKEEYLKANLFICPSSIENSPNSIGEAQILGVPVLASYAGGIPDMMKGDESHLYRFEEFEMLAAKIITIFEESDFHYTGIMRIKASKRHSATKNVKDLVEIYNQVNNSLL